MPSESSIPLPLDEVLAKIQDRAYAGRLRRVYEAAAHAIARLSDVDLVQYEITPGAEETPDLSLWEQMAPVIRDTVMDVNALLRAIREQFPPTVEGGLHEMVAKAAEEVGGPHVPTPESRRAQKVAEALQRAMGEIAQQITELGETMRSPQVVSDRWNLLAEIQKFRTLFRKEIAALVYDSASAFDDVSRRDAIPGYAEDLSSAVAIRSTVADLLRIASARAEKAAEAEPEDVQWNAQQLEKELDTFGRTGGYRGLRAQDKRKFLEARSRVGTLAAQPSPAKAELGALAREVVELVGSFHLVNQRDMLIVHDREVLAACGVRLEQAEGLLRQGPSAAAQALAEAALTAQALYGRDPKLDVFLRSARKTPLSKLAGAELPNAIEQFRALLAALPVE